MAITMLATAAKTSATIIAFAHLIWTSSALPTNASDLENAILALTKAVTALDKQSEFWETAMPWFTALVVAGLLGDLVVVIWERRDEVHAYRRWIRHSFNPVELPSLWKLVLELFSTSAIFIGVALELWAGVEIARINQQLRTKNGELRDKSTHLVALINESANGLEKKAASLTEQAEDERIKRIELQAEFGWRELAKPDQKLIASDLERFHNEQFDLVYQAGDPEELSLAIQLRSTLKNAKWIEKSFGGSLSLSPVPSGVLIFRTADKDSLSASDSLAKDLCAIGLDTSLLPPTSGRGLVSISIDPRPSGPQGKARFEIAQNNSNRQKCPIILP